MDYLDSAIGQIEDKRVRFVAHLYWDLRCDYVEIAALLDQHPLGVLATLGEARSQLRRLV